ncbi:alpha-N-acetylglucosaminidase [Virgibacillus dakarensis]|nr:alpha-N-acetylglucosaminidase [Virgibacillus dakarensis]
MKNSNQRFLAKFLIFLFSFLVLQGTAFADSGEKNPYNQLENNVDKTTHNPAFEIDSAKKALERLIGKKYAKQIHFKAVEKNQGKDYFNIKKGRNNNGTKNRILIEGTSPSALLTGFNWYLKYVAQANISWNGQQLNLPKKLPVPEATIKKEANVQNRFALNDTDEGYTQPYADWDYWERKIDILALHGINEVLVYPGQEAVYEKTFTAFGYTEAEMREWIPQPAHQSWWLLQNMSSFPDPISQDVIDKRVKLGKRIVKRLKELGMTPVFPGYFGTVPANFEEKNPDANVVPQGTWNGFQRPGWLDPTSELFSVVASSFYKNQTEMFGDTTMYKMDLLHEGGTAGNVNVQKAAKAVEKALEAAHPEAIWVILGWQSNPRKEILEAVDRSKMLIVDGLSDRYTGLNREQEWLNIPYAFGSIWNFGGHTTMGANMSVWNSTYWDWLEKPDSVLSGIAIMPEASDNNPVAFDFLSELAWRKVPVNLDTWFSKWTERRYGGIDQHAVNAWQALRGSAYSTPADGWSEAQDGLFGAEPSLSATKAASWSPSSMRYDPATFAKALPELLNVDPALRTSSAYQYDLMDVTRQVISNESRMLLPQIKAAYNTKDKKSFEELSDQWLHLIKLLDQVVGTNKQTMIGPWLNQVHSYAANEDEAVKLEYDARTLLTVWGNRAGSNAGLQDYANREWQGLVGDYYYSRWNTYFDSLDGALQTGEEPKPIDWYDFGNSWAKDTNNYPLDPIGDIHKIAQEVYDELASLPLASVEMNSDQPVVSPGESTLLSLKFTNHNMFVDAKNVQLSLKTPSGITAEALTDVSTDLVAPGETFTVKWRITASEEIGSKLIENLDAGSTYKINGSDAEASNQIKLLIAKDAQPPFMTKSFNDAIFSQSDEQFAIYGGGSDMWRQTNEYGVIFQEVAFSSGKTVTTKIISQDHTGSWARAGIVARNDLTKQKGSAGYINLAITPDNGCALSWDSNGDGTLDSYKNSTMFTAPVYVRLIREGTTFTGECSTDGETWTTVGTADVPGAAGTEDVGLFMTAANGSNDNKGIVQFEGFSIKPTKEISITDLKKQVKHFQQDGEIVSGKAADALTLHLTAVEQYVNHKENVKVVKHLKGFNNLLGHQKENKLLSEKAYRVLKEDTDYLIEKYQ